MKDELSNKLVRDGYEDQKIVARYSRDTDGGLWKAEDILIQRFFPKEGHVLDIGCGTGRTSIPLTWMGYNVTGIDLSANMVREAKLQADRLGLIIEFQQMDARTLDFADQTFDCALFSFNGIDHAPGYGGKMEVLQEIFRVLKPKATFVFSAHRIWDPLFIRQFIWSAIKITFGRLLHIETLEKEWGEFYNLHQEKPDGCYGSFMSSRRWKHALNTTGFDLVLCESRYRIELRGLRELKQNMGYHKLMHYASGNYMFYVARKPL